MRKNVDIQIEKYNFYQPNQITADIFWLHLRNRIFDQILGRFFYSLKWNLRRTNTGSLWFDRVLYAFMACVCSQLYTVPRINEKYLWACFGIFINFFFHLIWLFFWYLFLFGFILCSDLQHTNHYYNNDKSRMIYIEKKSKIPPHLCYFIQIYLYAEYVIPWTIFNLLFTSFCWLLFISSWFINDIYVYFFVIHYWHLYAYAIIILFYYTCA